MALVDLAAHLGVILPRHADLDLVECRDRVLDELVVDVLVHEDAAAGAADLALVEQDAQLHAVEHHVPLGVGEDDVGGFAAELKRRGDQALRRRARHVAADLGRAGEREFGDTGIVEDVLSGLGTAAGDHVEHAGGNDVLGQTRELEHRQARGRGGFEHGAVARGEHGSELPCRHEEREVPGNDLADDADGLMQHERHHVAGQHVGLAGVGEQAAGEVAEVVDRVRDVDGARLADGLAVVERLDKGEMLGVLLDDVGDLVQDDGALGLVGLAPGLERLPCRVDRAIDVVFGGVGDGGELLAVCGAVGVDGAAVGCVDPLAADVELIGLLGRIVHGEGSFRAHGTLAGAFSADRAMRHAHPFRDSNDDSPPDPTPYGAFSA